MIIFVDVDGTLIRESSGKQIPIPRSIEHIRNLSQEGATLYCWSSGGANYARRVADNLGIHDCFEAFLPKPDVLIDDLEPDEWSKFICVHPNEAGSMSLSDYEKLRSAT